MSDPGRRPWRSVLTRPARPLVTGFTVSVGVLLAAALAATVVGLSTVLVSLFLALFLALGLAPTVAAMSGWGIRRPVAILIVAAGFLVLVVIIVLFVLPTVVRQTAAALQAIPAAIAEIEASEWFASIEEALGVSLSEALREAIASMTDLGSFLAVSGGVLRAGAGVVGVISSGFLVVVLTLYFVASLDAMKAALAGLVPVYSRVRFVELTDEITASVGGMVSGGITLSSINAAVVFILQLIVGSSVPFLLAVTAFFVTLVPLVGSLVFLVIGTLAALFVNPAAALVFAIGYFAYIQLEAYFMTPRIMGKAVAVPAVLVIIGAMAGATLFGLLGALVAIPITASVLIVVRKVVVPRQNARTTPPEL